MEKMVTRAIFKCLICMRHVTHSNWYTEHVVNVEFNRYPPKCMTDSTHTPSSQPNPHCHPEQKKKKEKLNPVLFKTIKWTYVCFGIDRDQDVQCCSLWLADSMKSLDWMGLFVLGLKSDHLHMTNSTGLFAWFNFIFQACRPEGHIFQIQMEINLATAPDNWTCQFRTSSQRKQSKSSQGLSPRKTKNVLML